MIRLRFPRIYINLDEAIPWRCSKFFMFPVSQSLAASVLAHPHVSIVHKPLLSGPQKWRTGSVILLFLFRGEARSPEVPLLYLTLTRYSYISHDIFLTFVCHLGECFLLQNCWYLQFHSISAMTLRIPDEFSALHY